LDFSVAVWGIHGETATPIHRFESHRAQVIDIVASSDGKSFAYWCRKFKAGDISMDDLVGPGRLPIELSDAIMSLLSDEPFLSARVLAVRFSSTHQTIK
jgi:hypothetical protein